MSDSVAIINHLLIDDVLPLIRAYARPINPMAYALQCEFSWRHNCDVAEEASNVGHNRQYYDNLRLCLRDHEAEMDDIRAM
jgi:hypothetical protein